MFEFLSNSPRLAGTTPGVSSYLPQHVTHQPHSNEGLLDYPPQSLDQHNKEALASIRGGGGGGGCDRQRPIRPAREWVALQ